MSSPRPHNPRAFEPAEHSIVDAVGIVAERSFFAFVDPCRDAWDDDDGREWHQASVRFDDGVVSGTLACTLRGDLAQLLFDAFSGRDPAGPVPPAHLVDDLMGEFSNMVCGTWLSRCGGDRLFRIGRPVVQRVMHPSTGEHHRRWMAVYNRPLVVDWQVEERADEESEVSQSWR